MNRSIDTLSSENHAKKMTYIDKRIELEFILPNYDDVPTVSKAVLASQVDLAKFIPYFLKGEPASFDAIDKGVKTSLAEYYSGKNCGFWVFRGEERKFVSWYSVYPNEIATCECFEIGYWVNTLESNKGMGTLINKIMAVYMFAVIGIDRLEAPVNSGNSKSSHIYEKLGFKRDGIIRWIDKLAPMKDNKYSYEGTPDSIMYSLLANECNSLSWFSEVKTKLKVFTPTGTEAQIPKKNN